MELLSVSSDAPTSQERSIAKRTFQIIKFFLETGTQHNVDVSSANTVEELIHDPTYCPQLKPKSLSSTGSDVSPGRKIQIVEAFKQGGTSAVAKLLKKKNCPYDWRKLEMWRKQVDEGGSRHDKLVIVKEHVNSMFLAARHLKRSVMTCHLQAWALTKARELGLNSFKASERWLVDFKKDQRISSRKVTKYFTAKQVQSFGNDDEFDIKLDFVLDVKDTIATNNIPLCYVWNLD